MNKKWIAVLAAVVAVACMGCKGKIPSYLIVDGTTSALTIVDYSGDVPENLVIPKGIIKIDVEAFRECSAIRSVTISNSVTKIARAAFYNCKSLEHVTIPGNVREIGDSVFAECKSLKSVTMGKGVKKIGTWAFDECRRLEDVYYGGTEEEWREISISWSNTALTSATIHYNSSGPKN